MDMTKQQREDLAARIRSVRLDRYRGNRKAAYTAAGVNSNTWARAEDGETLAERSLVAIVHALWPETGGDWQRLEPPLGGMRDPEDEVRESNLSPATKDYILRVMAEDRAAGQADRGVKGA